MKEKALQKSMTLSKKTIMKLVKGVNYYVTARKAFDVL